MATTKVRQIYPSDAVPGMFSRSGRDPAKGCPLGWIEKWVNDVRRAIPTESERASVVVFGAEDLRAQYDDELTPAEQQADALAELTKQREAALSILPRKGEAMTAEAVEALRRALGGV